MASESLKDQAIMLLNEHPERDDEMMDPTEESQETTSTSPSPASDQDAQVQDSAVAETDGESDSVQEPAAEAAPAEPEASSDSPDNPEPDSEAPAESESSSEESTDEDQSTEPTEAPNAPEGHEAIITRIDALISSQEPGAHILTEVSIPELIQLINWMAYDSNLNQHAGRVNLVRHAFDALQAAGSLTHAMESDFRSAFAAFNKQRSKAQQSSSGVKEANAAKKRELIAQLREMVHQKNPELVGEVRNIQDTWKTIGQVPQNDLEPLYREYRSLLDEFYELRSVHLELMEYDRKKNLEERERLIEIAKTLVPAEADREDPEVWREKLDLLQELQQEWKSAGHVPREDMDRINEAYRDAIDEFFEVRQGFREIEDQQREENATKKEELLAQLEEFRGFTGDSPKTWNEATKKVREIQDTWKEIGPGPSKVNGELWSKYKDVCNAFYGNKSAFFKGLDDQRQENLEAKTKLAEKAEAIAARTDWEAAAKELKALQTQWRNIGPVPDKFSKKLWEQFRAACDSFFEARRAHYAELHSEEKDNLTYRKTLIEEVKALQESEMNPGEIVNAVKEIQAKWKASGRVPYKEKEKIWKEFRREVDVIFSGLDNRRGEARRERTVTRIENIDDDDERTRAIKGNIARLRKKIAASKEKVEQYSTNIQFIARGKSGDKLRNQIQGEIDKEETFIKELKKELKALDELLKNPPPQEEPAKEPEAKAEPAAKEETPAEEASAEAPTEAEAATPEAEPAVEAEAASEPEAAAETEPEASEEESEEKSS